MKIRFFVLFVIPTLLATSLSSVPDKNSSTPKYEIPKDYKEVQCTIEPRKRKTEHGSHPHIPGTLKLKSGQVSSTNWSGYAALTNISRPTNGAVTRVQGTWIVPTNVCTQTGYAAFWVGIDGYSSPTVEQIGTEHDCKNGKQANYAWFEMYPRGSFNIGGFPLKPGDQITGTVEYLSENVFILTLRNDTEKIFAVIPTKYTTIAGAKRQSAEWIVEAPYLNNILPLADFRTAYMSQCAATINGIDAPINSTSWQNVSLEMVTNSNVPKAIPSALSVGGNSFSVAWRHQ